MGVAGVTKEQWSNSVTWNSGFCARPSTPRSCWTGWMSCPAGRKKCAPCSATGLGAAKAPPWNLCLDAAAPETASGRDHGKVPLAPPADFVAGSAIAQDAVRIPVFTTRLDTIFGATSLQLAPQHPLAQQFAQADERLAGEVATLLEEQRKAREAVDPAAIEKRGSFTGHYAINPFSGERVPIWVANYILLEYGTGAVMSVPAHDQRDYEFAKKYGLEVRIVVLPRRKGEPPAAGQARRAGVALHRRRQSADELRRIQRFGLPGGPA